MEMQTHPATLTERVSRSVRRYFEGNKYGVRYVRASSFQTPDSITYQGKRYDLNLPKTTDNYIAFLDIFLDDVYKLEEIGQGQNNITQIMDVGGHSGLFSLYAKIHFPNAKVVAFEPNKKLVPQLAHHAQLVGFQYDTVAMGSKRGRVNLVENEESSVQNFTVYDDDGMIDVVTFADVQQQYGFKTIDILKMDCEGAEWDIFSDPSVLRNTRWLTMEYHLRGGKSQRDMFDLIEKQGFDILHTTIDGPTWGMLLAKNRNFKA